jgi:hypothetical protein
VLAQELAEPDRAALWRGFGLALARARELSPDEIERRFGAGLDPASRAALLEGASWTGYPQR